MEPEVHIIDKFFQEIEHCFTMTNVQCKGRKEIDLLAINPVSSKKFHVEARIATSRSFALTYKDTRSKRGSHRIGLDYFQKEKFNHPAVVERIKELFGDTNYDKILVVWTVKDTDAMGENFRANAYHEYGIHVYHIMDMINLLKEKGTMRGSRDDVLRLIELISLLDREQNEWVQKEIKRMKRAKTIKG